MEANKQIVDVLAFGAHPDDIELGCGGTLLRLKALGYSVGMVDVTRGERGSRGDAESRARESEAALKLLGFDFRENLDLGDQQVQDTPDRRLKVVECIRRHRPKLVFTHYWEDRHPDHEGTAALVKQAMFLAGAGGFPAEGAPHTPARLLHWPSRWFFEPTIIVDITDYYEKKIAAARCHTTQFYNEDLEQTGAVKTFISRPEFWEYLQARYSFFGSQIGVKYAEGFITREKLRVNDPVAFFTKEGT